MGTLETATLKENPGTIGGNIELRPFTDDDRDRLALYANNKNIAANLRDSFPFPYTEADADVYIGLQKNKGIQTDFVITYNSQFAGRIALDVKDDIYRKSAEIGYWLAEPFWGLGIATEAIKRISEYAIHHFELVRLFAICYESNAGSRRALEKAGFTLESIRVKAVVKYDEILNDCVYVKLV